MLQGEHTDCLAEWLRVAADVGVVAAPRDLPALLELGRRDAKLRDALGPVLGERGRWLARRHTEWLPVLGSGDVADDAWATGTPAERAQWLHERAARDPERAAAELIATWPAEDGATRERLLAAIASEPPRTLVPWLENTVLRDRRGTVRQLAREILLAFPDSGFATRARQRATPLLRVTGMLRKRLVVELPTTFDAAWRDDGVDEQPPTGVGARAHWARQLLALVPIDHWLATFGVDATTLFAWNRDDEWRALVLAAWADSLMLLPQPDVAVAFATHVLTSAVWPESAPPRVEFTQRWSETLPAPVATDVMDVIAARTDDPLFATLLLRGTVVHPPRDRKRTEQQALRLLAGPDGLPSSAPHTLANAIDPSRIAELLRHHATLPSLTPATEAFLRTLEFRQTFHAAFAAMGPA